LTTNIEGTITLNGVDIPLATTTAPDDADGLATALQTAIENYTPADDEETAALANISVDNDSGSLIFSNNLGEPIPVSFKLNNAGETEVVTQSAKLAPAVTLADKFANRETLAFKVTVNETEINIENATSLNDILAKINAQTPNTGVSAYLNASNDEIYFSSTKDNDFNVNIDMDVDGDGTFDDTLAAVTGTESDNYISLNDIDISTAAGADLALIAIDYAIGEINSFRADLGAIQNRFETTIANLSTSTENLSAARSRIQDADFAAESAELARTRVLQQAGLSVLAPANAKPQDRKRAVEGN